MIIKPKVRGFICTTAHPEGCRELVVAQRDYIIKQGKFDGPKKVLVIGASMGYGLASRISAAYGSGAATVGVIFDKPADENRTASAGWYNTAAFHEVAHKDGLYAQTINGDAYSKAIKDETISLIKRDLGKVDMVVYSLASPRRVGENGEVYNSVLKTIGNPYTNKSIDLRKGKITSVTIEPATEKEIDDTVKVMGGEDWADWISALKDADVLEDDAVTVAYSYVGPKLTHPIYTNGTIGNAKNHLHNTAKTLTKTYTDIGLKAVVSVNKALVTQSSAAIPVVPLYISILYKIMKSKGNHEGCIEQMYRLFTEKLYNNGINADGEGLIRLDDWEMEEEIQSAVSEAWDKITDETMGEYADIQGYWDDFYQLFGFNAPNVDYDRDVSPMYDIAGQE